MTTLRQAAEQALEALKLIDNAMPFPVAKLTIKHLQEVLAEESAQQEWVGLTDEEVLSEAKRFALGLAFPFDGITTPEMFARAIEAKIKDKNT